MLNQMPEIAAPHPPHILQTFTPLLGKYGNLNEGKNFYLLVTDICDFVAANPVVWEVKGLNAETVIDRCRKSTLIEIYKSVYEIYAEEHGAKIWCCKSMANLYFIPQIESNGIKPIYIHLVRDGRDVAASFRKAIVGEKHIYHLAKQWKQDQKTAKANCEKYAPDRYIHISYEDLIHDAENTMEKLLSRLGLHFNKSILDYYRTDEAKHTAKAGKMWNNVVQPVMTRNSNKFLTQLSAEDIMIFESIAGDMLETLGYQLHSEKSSLRASFSKKEIEEFDLINKKMKLEAQANLDPEGSEKRKAQEEIIQNIKTRA